MNPLSRAKPGGSGLWHSLLCPLPLLVLDISPNDFFVYLAYCFSKIAAMHTTGRKLWDWKLRLSTTILPKVNAC